MSSEGLVPRIGAGLRKIPGLSPLLDARLRRIRRRADQREADLHADRAADRARLEELGGQGGLRINVGCGPGRLEGWVNVDIVEGEWDDVLYMDVLKPWPLPDGSAEAISSEHFIEHITREQGAIYLREAARVLRPGGVIRTSTPSLRGTIDAYIQRDPEILAKYREGVRGWCDAENHADMFNNHFYEWGHRHIYDLQTLTAMLEEAGFGSIEVVEFGQSRHPVLRGIDIHDEGEELRSLVLAVDAVRP